MGDNSFPANVARVLFIAVTIVSVGFSISTILLAFNKVNDIYNIILKQTWNMLLQIEMLFQTTSFYYLADVGYEPKIDKAKAINRMKILSKLNVSSFSET